MSKRIEKRRSELLGKIDNKVYEALMKWEVGVDD